MATGANIDNDLICDSDREVILRGYPLEIVVNREEINPKTDLCGICNLILREAQRSGRCGHDYCGGCIYEYLTHHNSTNLECVRCVKEATAAEGGGGAKPKKAAVVAATTAAADAGTSVDDVTPQEGQQQQQPPPPPAAAVAAAAIEGATTTVEVSNKLIPLYPAQYKDLELDRKLTVKCIQHESCTWTGRLSDWDQHVKHNCSYTPIECPNSCATPILRNDDLLDHMQNYCPRRYVTCQFCQHVDQIRYCELPKHHEQCTKAPCVCPYCQSTNIPRDRVADHMEITCAMKPIDCPICPGPYLGQQAFLNHLVEPGGGTNDSKKLALHVLALMKELTAVKKKMDEMEETMKSERTVSECIFNELMFFRETVAKQGMHLSRIGLIRTPIKYEPNYLCTKTNGRCIWVIDNWAEKYFTSKDDPEYRLYCQPFFVPHTGSGGGYKLTAMLIPNGDQDAHGQACSLYLCLLKGEFDSLLPWPLRTKVTFTVFRPSRGSSSTDMPFRHHPPYIASNLTLAENPLSGPKEVGTPYGSRHFIHHRTLLPKCVSRDDTVTISIHVECM